MSAYNNLNNSESMFSLADHISPIIVGYGYPYSGKTRTLVRLTRHLFNLGYSVVPVRSYRPDSDVKYGIECEQFYDKIHDTNKHNNKDWERLLVSVYREGRCLCQICDEPGVSFYNNQGSNLKTDFTKKMIATPNKKVWIIFIELQQLPHVNHEKYVKDIMGLAQAASPNDEFIILVNKIDCLTSLYNNDTNAIYRELLEGVRYYYPGLLDLFMNTNPISKYWRPYNCRIVGFSSGTYYNGAQNRVTTYAESPDYYPKYLWQQIVNSIK